MTETATKKKKKKRKAVFPGAKRLVKAFRDVSDGFADAAERLMTRKKR